MPKSPPAPDLTRTVRRRLVGLSLLLFLLACATPALSLGDTSGSGTLTIWWGWEILLLGWLPILLGHVAWLANPCLLIALITHWLNRLRAAVLFSATAALLSIDTLRVGSGVPSDESGNTNIVLHGLLPGWYLWLAAILVMLGGSIYLVVARRADVAATGQPSV